jgi:Na+:H+ antiporter, NhaA family
VVGEVRIGPAALTKDLEHWINDGLIALFFSPKLVGLEIEREVLQGSARQSPERLAADNRRGRRVSRATAPLRNHQWNDPQALYGWAIRSVVGICAMLGRAAPPAQWSCRASGFLRVGSPEAHSLTPNQSHPIILTAA